MTEADPKQSTTVCHNVSSKDYSIVHTIINQAALLDKMHLTHRLRAATQ